MSSPGFFGPHSNVYVYIPNLIGYGRVICYIGSLIFAFSNPELCCGLYFLAFFGDVLDGKAARMFGQSSTFGGVLDMVSDRMATTCFLIILSHLYPSMWLLFVGLCVLDLSSHWFHMYSTLLENRGHHKDANQSSLFIVNFYYTQYWFFAYCCVGAEVVYLALYLLHGTYYQQYPALPIHGCCLAHLTGMSVLEGPLSLASFVTLVCLPGCAIKQLVNVVQLCSAANIIVKHDLETKKK